MTEFSMATFYNEALPEGTTRVDVIIRVTAAGAPAADTLHSLDAAAPRAEVIIIDASGSMNGAGKLRQARAAAAVAVDGLSDGVHFAVVAGNDQPRLVYPPVEELAVSSPQTRLEATTALKGLTAGGGTAIGSWLNLATRLLWYEAGIRHVILLTDGRNESESAQLLDGVLETARGVFQCDCRGVGTDFDKNELKKIADALLGTYDIVVDPRGLAADFAQMTQASMAKQVASVVLRVWAPQDARIEYLKQVFPTLMDISPAEVNGSPLLYDFGTGAWGNESRDYHLCVQVPTGAVDDRKLAARVTLLVNSEPREKRLVEPIWTDDVERNTQINHAVAHYTDQAELAAAIDAGVAARRDGDLAAAEARFGRAVQLADAAGNTEKLGQLRKIVDVEDAGTARVRMKTSVSVEDEMTLDTRSTKTQRVQPR